MIYVIGLDPGSISGWALVAADLAGRIQILAHGHTGKPGEPTQGGAVRTVLARIGTDYPNIWPPTVVSERLFIPDAPHHGKQRGAAVGVFGSQIHLGRWLGVAEAFGCPVYVHHDKKEGVPPSIWRKAQWGRAQWTTPAAKEHAVRAARTVWGLELPKAHHHAAEACFIGAFGATEIRQQRRLERQKGPR